MESLFQLDKKETTAGNDDKYAEIIIAPYIHIKKEKLMKILVEIYNRWMNVDQNLTDRIADILQRAQVVSLLIDDIQDASVLRRGIPTAHIIYGVGQTIAAVDLSLSVVYSKTIDGSEATSEYVQITLDCIKNSFEGQVMEIYWRDNFICPTEEEYLHMTIRKTSYEFKAINLYLELFSTANIHLNNISLLFGIYFQLCEDYNGLKSTMHYKSKGFCDEIREGKFTFPIVHAVNSRSNDKRILNILKMHTIDINVKRKCLELLEEFGSLEYTRKKILFYKNLIIQEISKFEPNFHFNQMLEKIGIQNEE